MKSSRWLVVELTAIIATVFVALYVIFMLMLGISPNSVPTALVQTSDARNIFICISHTISYVLFMIYFSSFIRPKMFEWLIIASSLVTMLLHTLCMVLVWRCYFLNELESLIFVLTLNGIMLSAFALTFSYSIYSMVDEGGSRNITKSFMHKLLNFSAILFYLAAIFIYYRYLSGFLYSTFNIITLSRDIDALALFCFIVALILQCSSFIIAYFIDCKAVKNMLEEMK